MAASVRVVDRGANALVRRLEEGRQPKRAKVGVIGSEAGSQHSDGQLTVADVASFNEFGIGVPERSFIRAYVDENEPELRRRLRAIADAVVKDPQKSIDIGLEQFGQKVVGEIQERISAGIPPPNSPETIARKQGGGSTTPLIDTGQLRSSITHLVEEGGSEGTVG